MKILTRRARRTAVVGAVGVALFVGPLALPVDAVGRNAFSRLATFSVSANAGSGSAEIVAAADNGRTLLYTDAGAGLLGFVDVRDPSNPAAAGSVAVGGSPTSVAVQGRYALVLVDDTPVLADETFGPHAGRLVVVDVASRSIVRTVDLGGQPDSVKISPDGCWAVIAIENQRDENVADGVMPHIPANGARLDEPGWVTIVDLKGAPARWTTKQVELVGLPGLKFPEDPEPEFVDVNQRNQAAVTLQENNHVVIIDAPSAKVVGHWSAGAVAPQVADTSETPSDIVFGGAISLPREPDAVSWVDDRRLVTSDEGDYEGGSRSFTMFDVEGQGAAGLRRRPGAGGGAPRPLRRRPVGEQGRRARGRRLRDLRRHALRVRRLSSGPTRWRSTRRVASSRSASCCPPASSPRVCWPSQAFVVRRGQ